MQSSGDHRDRDASRDGNRLREGAGTWAYIREALFFRWNLLLLTGAGIAAMLGPSPDIVLPIVGAVELLYLAGLTSIPKFRHAIDAMEYAKSKGGSTQLGGTPDADASRRAVMHMLQGLDSASRQRFDRLRNRCSQMQRLASDVRGRADEGVDTVRAVQTPALDRLLWTFLRLLYSQHALQRFLQATDEGEIKDRIKELREREQEARQKNNERVLHSLTDSIATTELRLDNYQKAKSNAEFVAVEIERIEGKIQALTEMAVSHQSPDYISSQVDSVAQSMSHTEEAMRELNAITGLGDDLQGTPLILETTSTPTGGR